MQKGAGFGAITWSWVLVLLFTTGFGANAQRVNIGIGLNTGSVYIPTSMRTLLVGSVSGALSLDSTVRPGSHAPFFGLGVSVHARLFELNTNQSVGLVAHPMFGFYIPQAGTNNIGRMSVVESYGGPVILHVPVMLQYAQGMFSSIENDKNQGWGLGLGMEASWLRDSWQAEARSGSSPFNYTYYLAPNFLMRPVGAVYWRYWTSMNLPVEWALQFSSTRQTYDLDTVNRLMVRLSYLLYLNF